MMREIEPALQQMWTVVCGWHEMAVHHIQSDDPRTAMFKAQCQAWRESYALDPQSMAGVQIEDVAVVAVFLGKMDNLYPFMEEP
jgi:hypothetical protein